MARLSTLPYHGYAVEFSPYEGSTLAVAGAVNYGITGKLHVDERPVVSCIKYV